MRKSDSWRERQRKRISTQVLKGRKTKEEEIVEKNNFRALAKKNNNDRKEIQETEFVFVLKCVFEWKV